MSLSYSSRDCPGQNCSWSGSVISTGQVICPIARGDVTFHHSKTPHMTNANTSPGWRKAVTNHMQKVGAGGEGDHYPWKITEHQGLDRRRPAKAE